MTDDHYPIECETCGTRPTLARLGSKKPAEHASFGIECECDQLDGRTPVGTFVELNNLPDSWNAGE